MPIESDGIGTGGSPGALTAATVLNSMVESNAANRLAHIVDFMLTNVSADFCRKRTPLARTRWITGTVRPPIVSRNAIRTTIPSTYTAAVK